MPRNQVCKIRLGATRAERNVTSISKTNFTGTTILLANTGSDDTTFRVMNALQDSHTVQFKTVARREGHGPRHLTSRARMGMTKRRHGHLAIEPRDQIVHAILHQWMLCSRNEVALKGNRASVLLFKSETAVANRKAYVVCSRNSK